MVHHAACSVSGGDDHGFECRCCGAMVSQEHLGAYVGTGELHAVCLPCYGTFTSLGSAHPDKTIVEKLDGARLLRAINDLSTAEQKKLQRLDFLIRNRSARAERLSGLASAGRISFSQLLAII